ncbi:FkbM family methyltransferase [Pedobacter heparinus]|uniref:FkbM family methyltransferase n=1 Tax=Pedobacter heparinus TaxID=984 RepID=UPI0029312F8F|nr:FkbM family methyltransferase [Pedobacter heparinus]
MKRKDRIRLIFTRNWKLTGKQRFINWFKPSASVKVDLKNGITWLTDEDIAIYTTADNYIEWNILSTGTYEHEINKLIRISLKDGDVALDVGANIGLQSIRMSKSVGEAGRVLAFEPLTYLQKKLAANILLNRSLNVTLLPYALANIETETKYDINENEWNQGAFSLDNNTENGDSAQKIAIKKGDILPEIINLNRLDLIKIDVEGFEFQVMLGLAETIKKYLPRIIFEYDHNYWTKTNQNISECFNFLKVANYKVFQITSVGCELRESPEQITGGNLFCLQAEHE